jgi:hypothetical protein
VVFDRRRRPSQPAARSMLRGMSSMAGRVGSATSRRWARRSSSRRPGRVTLPPPWRAVAAAKTHPSPPPAHSPCRWPYSSSSLWPCSSDGISGPPRYCVDSYVPVFFLDQYSKLHELYSSGNVILCCTKEPF